MAVRIRLTRVGATKRPAYRVIAIDRRRSRDGRALEILGFYDPLTEPATVQLQSDRISAWIGKGAQPSETVVRLMRQAEKEAASPPTEKPKRPSRPKQAASTKPKASKKAAAAPAAEEEASPEADAAAGPKASAANEAETPQTADAVEESASAETTAASDTAVEAAADSAVEPAVMEDTGAEDATPAPDGQVEEREA
ncbi:MAG: 30S ribosomal protein S16 [Chloroflexi bacterium]|nr:30S ribosomal protein S16 [Chloroflexota bacterium]